MAEKAPSRIGTFEQFRADMQAINVSLPLKRDEGNIGCVMDATGRDVFTVDVASARADDEAEKIAVYLAYVINFCGGIGHDPASADESAALETLRRVMTVEQKVVMDQAAILYGRKVNDLVDGLMDMTIKAALIGGVSPERFAAGMQENWAIYAEVINKSAVLEERANG